MFDETVSLRLRDGQQVVAGLMRVEHLRRYLRPQLEGYIYVVEFSSGTIKVGKTKDITKRLAQHAKEARNHGLTIVQSWQSPAHTCWGDSEQLLIAFCWEHFGHPVSGDEYFIGADFDVIAQFTATLFFPVLQPRDLDLQVAEHIWAEQAGDRKLLDQQRANRIAAGLPADLPDPVFAQAARDWFDSLTDEEAEEVGAEIRHRLAREDWLERKAERKRMREIEALMAPN